MDARVRHAEDQLLLPWMGSAKIRIVAPAEVTDGKLSVVSIEADAGYIAAPHIHSREDETFYVLSGTAEFSAGATSSQVSAGGLILLPRGLPHGFQVLADQTLLLNVCTPGGLDGFFTEMAAQLGDPGHQAATVASIVAEVATRYGISYPISVGLQEP